jgi:hypothetical protein
MQALPPLPQSQQDTGDYTLYANPVKKKVPSGFFPALFSERKSVRKKFANLKRDRD